MIRRWLWKLTGAQREIDGLTRQLEYKHHNNVALRHELTAARACESYMWQHEKHKLQTELTFTQIKFEVALACLPPSNFKKYQRLEAKIRIR